MSVKPKLKFFHVFVLFREKINIYLIRKVLSHQKETLHGVVKNFKLNIFFQIKNNE